MATGEARRAQATDPRPVAILDKYGNARWHALWDGNPRIARKKGPGVQTIVNGPGCRPYIDYAAMKAWAAGHDLPWDVKDRRIPWRWKADYRATPGEIMLAPSEIRAAGPSTGFVVIEPNIKPSASPNKDWGFDRWQKWAADSRWMFVGRSADDCLVQFGPPGTRTVKDARLVHTTGFRQACAILMRAAAFIGTDGALHHAAAALGVPAVVIWGGFTSPRNLGYVDHVNLAAPGEPCGMREPCEHCAAAMAAIEPEQVSEALGRLLQDAAFLPRGPGAPLEPPSRLGSMAGRTGGDPTLVS